MTSTRRRLIDPSHPRGLDQPPSEGCTFSAVPAPVEGMGTFPVRAFAVVA